MNPPMKFSRLVPFLCLALFACGSSDPLVGKWAEVDAQHGWEIEFAADGRMMIHGEGADHGSHDHCNGTWQQDGQTLRITGRWESAGKDAAWTATIQDDVLTLTPAAGEGVRRLRRR